MAVVYSDNLIVRKKKEVKGKSFKKNYIAEFEEIRRKREPSQTRTTKSLKNKNEKISQALKTKRLNSQKKRTTRKPKPPKQKTKAKGKEKEKEKEKPKQKKRQAEKDPKNHSRRKKKKRRKYEPIIRMLNRARNYCYDEISEPDEECDNELFQIEEQDEHKNNTQKKKKITKRKKKKRGKSHKRRSSKTPIKKKFIHKPELIFYTPTHLSKNKKVQPKSNTKSQPKPNSHDPRKFSRPKQKLMVSPQKLFQNLKNKPLNTNKKTRKAPFTFQNQSQSQSQSQIQKTPIKVGNYEAKLKKALIRCEREDFRFNKQSNPTASTITNKTNSNKIHTGIVNLTSHERDNLHKDGLFTNKTRLYYVVHMQSNAQSNSATTLCKIINPIDYQSNINYSADTQFTEYIKTNFLEVLFKEAKLEKTKIRVGDLLEISPSKFEVNNNCLVGIKTIVCTDFIQKLDKESKTILDRICQDKGLQTKIQKAVAFYEKPNYSIFLSNPKRKQGNVSIIGNRNSPLCPIDLDTDFVKIENICTSFQQLSMSSRNVLVRCLAEFSLNNITFWIVRDVKQALALIQIPNHIKQKMPIMCKLYSVSIIKWQARLNLQFSRLISLSLHSINPMKNIILLGTSFDFKIMIIEKKK
ncbi:hypothetical protein M0813_26966 [Anaeramoeba flamelloides]|uniref:Uncharacterized protein n=1 Tax=Anaeramoeba flamelloides TaxID=1746091 RepID=A0ABQ8XZP2_9EUKA|nr:hypothetical protein M0813_26966 [Anaeramoeba flamelloides]